MSFQVRLRSPHVLPKKLKLRDFGPLPGTHSLVPELGSCSGLILGDLMPCRAHKTSALLILF